jgi:aryl-alcohol dehydrogenase-like predicted oxidoreductase
MTAYGVLSRGLIADTEGSADSPMRGRMPRFSGENYPHNRRLVERLAAMARERGVLTSQLAIAWVAAQGTDIVPLIGTTRPERVDEALAALAIELSPADLAAIAETLPAGEVAGTRYAAHQMEMLDSERG